MRNGIFFLLMVALISCAGDNTEPAYPPLQENDKEILEHLPRIQVIFAGKVIAVDHDWHVPSGVIASFAKVKYEVIKIYKGPQSNRIDVAYGIFGGERWEERNKVNHLYRLDSRYFQMGKAFIVFASKVEYANDYVAYFTYEYDERNDNIMRYYLKTIQDDKQAKDAH